MEITMWFLLTLTFPMVLLAVLTVMGRVEEAIGRDLSAEQLVEFLDSARPEDVETFVTEGFAAALDRYWGVRRRRAGRRGRIMAA
jgi:hypothetical protein